MALAKTLSASIEGVSAFPVGVEANIGPGLPGMYVVGLAGAAMAESKDRLKTAMANCGLPWPKTKLVVNLSPADVRKSGSHFDVAICAAVMSATLGVSVADTMFMGEVGLDGSIKPVPGVLPALLAAREEGIKHAIIPSGNEAEAALISEPYVMVASHIRQLADWMMGVAPLERAQSYQQQPASPGLDMADVIGQPQARKAAEIAAAGGHHLMMIGPPGSGKSMLAARLPSIMPPLSNDNLIEVTAIQSVANLLASRTQSSIPFVSPHHSVSQAALLGGGSGKPKPGAVSLAHRGVLFLDEVSEIPAHILDSLRIPLESGEVHLQRGNREIVFPAQFQLVLATNPCRCGAEDILECTCSSTTRRRFLSNLSGPLKDRIDLCVRTHKQGATLHSTSENSASIAQRVAAARDRMIARWGVPASRVDARTLRREYCADEAAMAYLGVMLVDGELSQRGVDRTLKVAWTIADLEGQSLPTLDHVIQAIELHDFSGADS